MASKTQYFDTGLGIVLATAKLDTGTDGAPRTIVEVTDQAGTLVAWFGSTEGFVQWIGSESRNF